MKLFTYATLRSRANQRKALGHIEPETKAVLPGYAEVQTHKGGGIWPNIIADDRVHTKGDILEVPEADLKKLDSWEDHYSRIKVKTSGGEAWAYVLKKGK